MPRGLDRWDVSRVGEFGWIDALRKRAGKAAGWRVGIGDDAAVLAPRAGHELVVTADTLVEDVHFRWSTTDARSLGRKALAVNLSDLAAMGARPLGFLLSIGLPAGADPARLKGVALSLLQAARDWKCPLVGGNTTTGPGWSLAITALGETPSGQAWLRSGAQPGDRILVTGALGHAALGLTLLERRVPARPDERTFLRAQRAPRPRLDEARVLARLGCVTAAIDVSDGLAQDLGHMLRASGAGARIDLDRLPVTLGFRRACGRHGLDPLELILRGGEDYELLFCVSEKGPSAVRLARRLGCPVADIGVVTRGRMARFERDEVAVAASGAGFDHFKRSRTGSEK